MIANSILRQRIIPADHMGVYPKRGSNANDRKSIFDVSHDYVRKLCPKENTVTCHFSDIDVERLSFNNPCQDKLSPVTPSKAPLCIRHSRCYIRLQ